jgi:glycine dehydrogenase subunit 1
MDKSPTFPYIPNTAQEREEMLKAIGVESVQELFSDIPEEFRNPTLNIPGPISELELRQEIEALAKENLHSIQTPSFLGAGAYQHFIPAVVQAIATRGEFLTAYTPYQPEVSQGTLQTAYELQTLICQLFDMDVANAGMYEGASSLAEAALMACRVTHRYRVGYLNTLSPSYLQVLRTYTEPQGVDLYPVSPISNISLMPNTSCLIVQHPNFFGYMENLALLEKATHKEKALLVVSTDPIALGMFRAPGSYGADIVTAEGQSLGIPVSYGGPYIGLFSCKNDLLRQMPGRIIGRTVDTNGKPAYVLTLQTREQHIRRERATSNICTSQALVGLMATVYLATLGKLGLKEVSNLCYHKAHYAESLIRRIPGYTFPINGTFFQEFVVQCPKPPSEINDQLLDRGIMGGLDVSDQINHGLLLCVTEMNSRKEIELLAKALSEIA